MPVELSRRFAKEFRRKSIKMQAAILETITRLDAGDTAPGLRRKPMKGYDGIWEASVDMHNRVTFEIDGEILRLRANCNHDILRRP